MYINPKGSGWPDSYFDKLCDLLENGTSLILPKSKEEVLKYLKFWNTTQLNNSSTVDIINYEQLIYYEEEYKDDEEIQLLIKLLKEKIAYYYKLKAAVIDNYVDKDLYKDPDTFSTQWGKKMGIWE